MNGTDLILYDPRVQLPAFAPGAPDDDGAAWLPQEPTLADLIAAFRADPVSSFHGLRYHVRENHHRILDRLARDQGWRALRTIKARTIKQMHIEWSAGGKIATASLLLGQLRVVCGYGADMLENAECERLCLVMHRQRFPGTRPRKQRMMNYQAETIRTAARRYGHCSIALGQAFQFELMLRQKDVIGEWVPIGEPGDSDIVWPDADGKRWKWLRGIRWEEVDDRFILRHTTSKKTKDIEVDLLVDAPMVAEELCLLAGVDSAAQLRREMFYREWPIIICEHSGLPWDAQNYRRKWRLAASRSDVPKELFNMDSRSGAISEAFEAGAVGDDIRGTATHSSITQTEAYNRGSYRRKSKNTAAARRAHRAERRTAAS